MSVAVVMFPLLMATLDPSTSYAAKHKASPMEIAQLPQFCWEEYVDGVSGYEYSTRRKDCGPGMNHYCSGLVGLIRAKNASRTRKERLVNLDLAKGNTLYTLNYMKDYPNCSLRSHVEKTLSEINGLLMVLGKK